MRSIVAIAMLVLSACASSPPAATTVGAADPNAPACHREVPTGSNVWHTVCVRQTPDDQNQRAISDIQDRIQHSPAVKAGTTLSND